MGSEQRQDIVIIRSGEQPVQEDKQNRSSQTCLSPILPSRGIDLVKVALSSGELVAHNRLAREYINMLSG